MSNGKKSKRHHPNQAQSTGNANAKTSQPEPRGLDITPLANKIDGLINAYTAANQNSSGSAEKQLFWSRVAAISTFAAFVAAGIYAAFAYGQWRDLGKNFEIEQRARLYVSSVESKDVTDGLQMTFHISNTGHIPSNGLAINTGWLYRGMPSVPPENIGGRLTQIYPGIDKSLHVMLPPLRQEQRDALAKADPMGQPIVNVFGEIVYGIGFGKLDLSLFCYTLFPDSTWHSCSIASTQQNEGPTMFREYEEQQKTTHQPSQPRIP